MFPSNLVPLQRQEVSASWERGLRGEDFHREIDSSGSKDTLEIKDEKFILQTCRKIKIKTHHIPLCESTGFI